MSIKSLVQFLILLSIVSIISVVYFKYFKTNKDIVEEINSIEIENQEQLKNLELKIKDLEIKNNELIEKIDQNRSNVENFLSVKEPVIQKKEKDREIISGKIANQATNKNIAEPKDQIKNLIKDVVYNSIDEKGNKFYLLANSAKSDINDKDILDLVNVRGEISSDYRDTIYIVSDFAKFNTTNSNSKFYDNVIINYQEKKITCINFDINMETNIAIAYNDVIITDPKSTMKAGLVEFDLKTKNININPETASTEIKVITN